MNSIGTTMRGDSHDNVDDETVARFVAATNATVDHALFFLQACGGNYDKAVEMYREQRGGGGLDGTTNPIPPRPVAPGPSRGGGNTSTSAALGRRRNLTFEAQGLPRSWRFLPLIILRGSLRLVIQVLGIGTSVVGAVGRRVLPRGVVRWIEAVINTVAGPPQIEDPAASAAGFVRGFAAQYSQGGNRPIPTWHVTGWEEAAADAHSQGRLLFVYLHSARHQHTDRFVVETLCNPLIVEYLNANFVCWAGDLRTSDAFGLASRLQVASYPCCVVLAFSGARTQAVTYIQGMLQSPERFLNILQSTVEQHAGLLWEDQAIRNQYEADRRLRQEQDAEFARALEADREREARQRAAREEEEATERARAEAELTKERRKAAKIEAIEKRRVEKNAILLQEPASSSDSQDLALIRVRFPSGAHHQRRFLATNVLEDVYNWVDSMEGLPFFQYSLVTTFPKKVLDGDSKSLTLQDLGLCPQAALLIQPEDEEEDNEEE